MPGGIKNLRKIRLGSCDYGFGEEPLCVRCAELIAGEVRQESSRRQLRISSSKACRSSLNALFALHIVSAAVLGLMSPQSAWGQSKPSNTLPNELVPADGNPFYRGADRFVGAGKDVPDGEYAMYPVHFTPLLTRQQVYSGIGRKARALKTGRGARRSASEEVGTRRQFFTRSVFDQSAWLDLEFELVFASPEVGIWLEVQAGDVIGENVRSAVVDSLSSYALHRTGAYSEHPRQGILSLDEQYFGDPPDVDGDGRLDLLVLDIEDDFERTGAYVAGFFDPVDLIEHPNSNRRDVLYIDLYPTLVWNGETRVQEAAATLAHEYQHLIHAGGEVGPRTELPFVNEGLSELAEMLCGFSPRSARAYFEHPARSLFSWDYSDPIPDYARASLWAHYLFEQVGFDQLRSFVQDTTVGLAGIDNLTRRAGSRPFDELFRDWGLTLLSDGYGESPRHRYAHPLRHSLSRRARTTIDGFPDLLALPAPPLSHTFIAAPLTADLVLDSWAVPSGAAATALAVYPNARGGGVPVPVVLPNGSVEAREGPYGSILTMLSRGRTDGSSRDGGSTQWELTMSGEASGREEVLRYDDGIPDPFSGNASYLLQGQGEALALTFAAPEARWIRGVDVKLIFLSELSGSPISQDAARDLVVEIVRVENGHPGALLAPARHVRVRRPFGNLRFESVDLSSLFGDLGAVRDSFAVVLRNDEDDDNFFAVALDAAAANAPVPDGWWRSPATPSWSPLAGRTVGGQSLSGWSPIIRVHAVGPAEPGRSLPAPRFEYDADSLYVILEGPGALDESRSLAHARFRSGLGVTGTLLDTVGGEVRYGFRAPETGEVRLVFRLTDAETDEQRGGTFTWTLPDEHRLAAGAPYPNPTVGPVSMDVTLSHEGEVTVTVFDLLGREVRRLGPTPSGRGSNDVRLDLAGLAGGVYVVRVAAAAPNRGLQTETRKIVLVH